MSEFIKGIDATIWVALVGILSAIVSAIVSRLQTVSTFKAEIAKLNLERRHEQDDQYLESAKKQTGKVYVPLSAALSKLKYAFQSYVYQGHCTEQHTNFNAEIDRFITTLEDLGERGAAAYFTTELEDVLVKFAVFLRTSKNATETVVDVAFNFSVGFGNFRTSGGWTKENINKQKLPATMITQMSLLGIDARVSVSDLIQAPVDSKDFQLRFERDTHLLSILVKEVTLGRAARTA